jgi:HemY protein
MRGLAWLIVIFSAAVLASLIARNSEGYVLVFAPPWRIELSLVLAIGAILAAFLLLHFVLRLIGGVLNLPRQAQVFRNRKQTEKGRAAMATATLAFMEGRYGHAEKAAAQAVELGEAPLQNALLAAAAAHRVRNSERRDAWLARAESFESGNPTARLMSAAEMLLEEGRHAEALALLDRLHESGPRHIAALRMIMRAQQLSGRWEASLRVLRQLEKRNALPAAQISLLKLKAHQELMRQHAHDAASLRAYWDAVPDAEKLDTRIAARAAREFVRVNDAERVRSVVEAALERDWNPELAACYGEAIGNDALPRLERAETWLKLHPREPDLLRALGKLCTAQRLWGKAQSYLEASLSLHPVRATCIELAKLMEQIGQPERAQAYFRQAAEMQEG